MPKLSVIIPVFNYFEVVSRAIQSVVDQLTSECELLVVNDGSTDSSESTILSLRERHHFNYLCKENEGLAATRNYGIDRSSGDYIVFLDADDYFLEGAIDEIIRSIHRSDCPIIIYGHDSLFSDGSKKYTPPPCTFENTKDAFLAYGEKKFALSSGSVVFNRQVFDKIRFPVHLRHAEDQPVYALLLANFDFSVDGFPTCMVVKHDSSMRKDASAAIEVDTETVDYLFSHPSFPGHLHRYKRNFLSSRLLSLFRTLYRANRIDEAMVVYIRAIKMHPARLLKIKYLSKAIRATFSSRFKLSRKQG